MDDLRAYGKPPFNVVVVHGGPGARGEMARVARRLSKRRGVLEPLQTATSVHGQVEELKAVLEKEGDLPATLVGFSWGAWLSFIFAASYPAMVEKLVLVGSGPFEEKYAARIAETRLSRLSLEERAEVESIVQILESSENVRAEEKNAAMTRMGALFSKVDAYDPATSESEDVDCRADVFQGVWKEAAELRKIGRLLELGEKIKCPVVAIHGDYDPHPALGVELPLSAVLRSFRFILLEKCGHAPWIEKEASEKFYEILEKEWE
ncbi:alpha/beta fold hydrolase [Methanocrinis sp.]|uniref:alpha/beta fold hydrolase n=1 Tax=Methanocrinis sp. TaxID=3101522 RepID=UPI003D12A4F1